MIENQVSKWMNIQQGKARKDCKRKKGIIISEKTDKVLNLQS